MTESEASHAMANVGMVILFAPWIIAGAYLGLAHFVRYATGWAGLLPRELRR